jgi:hypothetical protein
MTGLYCRFAARRRPSDTMVVDQIPQVTMRKDFFKNSLPSIWVLWAVGPFSSVHVLTDESRVSAGLDVCGLLHLYRRTGLRYRRSDLSAKRAAKLLQKFFMQNYTVQQAGFYNSRFSRRFS